MLKELINKSIANLNLLAKELALNYFEASTIDLGNPDKLGESIREEPPLSFVEEVLDIKKLDAIQGFFSYINEGTLKDSLQDNEHFEDIKGKLSRNILVIGAGASYNAFQDIPLAKEAIDKIHEKVIVKTKNKHVLTLKDFLAFYECEKLGVQDDKKLTIVKKIDDELKKDLYTELNINGNDGDALNWEYGLLNQIGQKYFSEYSRLHLLNSDYKNKKDVDFENSLNLLAKIIPVSTLRQAIKETYDFQHAPTLFYQIAAHLFKHRFIDVIINFNFDELLDRVIEDEIGPWGFDRIISDGDCVPTSELVIDGRLRQPLYIKPHGTLSHKSTLRFTKDQYHEIPQDIRTLLEDIISSSKEIDYDGKKTDPKRVNLITVGFEMNSIEFNEILAKNLPDKSKVFNFFHHKEEDDIEKKLHKKTKFFNRIFRIAKDTKDEDKKCTQIYFIGHEFFTSKIKNSCTIDTLKTTENFNDEYGTLGNTFLGLFNIISGFYKDMFVPGGISKHLLITELFGNRDFWGCPELSEKCCYPRSYFCSSDYFKDRVLIEILISLTKNYSWIDPIVLMKGRTGYYYYLYDKAFRLENKDNISSPIPLLELIRFFEKSDDGKTKIHALKLSRLNVLKQIEETIDSKETASPKNYTALFNKRFEAIYDKISNDRYYFSSRFTNYINANFSKQNHGKDYVHLLCEFKKMKDSRKLKINSRFRTADHHIFAGHEVKHLINTDLICDLHFKIGLLSNVRPNSCKKILIVADYGYQAAKLLTLENLNIGQYDNGIQVYLILHDSTLKTTTDYGIKKKLAIEDMLLSLNLPEAEYERKELVREKLSSFRILFLPINEHNHHMTIFLNVDNTQINSLKENEISRCIYYYKKGLSSDINPIRLNDLQNKKQLLEIFRIHSESAYNHTFPDKNDLANSDFEWIKLTDL